MYTSERFTALANDDGKGGKLELRLKQVGHEQEARNHCINLFGEKSWM